MDFLQLTLLRSSVRHFSNTPVAQADIDYIMECVRMAPSACNRQPWQFVIVESPEARDMIHTCYAREWFATAPLYVVCLKSTTENWIRPDDQHPHGDIDVAIATEHLCLAAAERDLGTCWVCNFDVARTRQLFAPEGFEPVAIVPIGHPATDYVAPEKKRKSMADIVTRR